MRKSARTTVNAEINLGVIFIVCNFWALLNAEIAGITVYYFVILPD